jgi:MerR family transcriptional regulator, heat shock protein HspR
MSDRYVPLSEAATRAGVSPAFLEMLEHEGIIELKRTLDDVVVISRHELERVRVVALLTEELDVNLAGAEVIIRMREDMIAMRRQFEEILVGLVAELKRGLGGARGGEE